MLVYGVTRDEDIVEFHPFDVFRREITIKGSFAEITSFGAAIAALRTGRVRTDGIITHRFGLDDYGKALDALAQRPDGAQGRHRRLDHGPRPPPDTARPRRR